MRNREGKRTILGATPRRDVREVPEFDSPGLDRPDTKMAPLPEAHCLWVSETGSGTHRRGLPGTLAVWIAGAFIPVDGLALRHQQLADHGSSMVVSSRFRLNLRGRKVKMEETANEQEDL